MPIAHGHARQPPDNPRSPDCGNHLATRPHLPDVVAPYFGSSIYVWGSIITVFMAALALGYLIGGRASSHSPGLVRFSAIFLVAAVTIVPLILLGEQVMDGVFLHIEDPRYGSLVSASLMFGLPSIVLGMISPYSVRLQVEYAEHSGAIAGLLSFVSTGGSALGTLLTSFYFVLWFEMNTLLIAMSVALAVLGGVGLLGHRLLESPTPEARR
jgi:hypothetical protein